MLMSATSRYSVMLRIYVMYVMPCLHVRFLSAAAAYTLTAYNWQYKTQSYKPRVSWTQHSWHSFLAKCFILQWA